MGFGNTICAEGSDFSSLGSRSLITEYQRVTQNEKTALCCLESMAPVTGPHERILHFLLTARPLRQLWTGPAGSSSHRRVNTNDPGVFNHRALF